MKNSGDLQSALRRRELVERLRAQRRQIERTVRASHEGGARRTAGFPRSRTMRLLLGEPVLIAAVSALAVRVFGRRAVTLIPSAFALVRIWRKAVSERSPAAAHESRRALPAVAAVPRVP